MIPASIHALLEPLETFESIRRRAVRFGDRLCDLAYANPYQGAHEDAREALRRALDERRLLSLQYAPFGGHTVARRLVADDLRRSHDLPFAHRDVVLTPGAMSALQIALWSAAGQGGEVVIPTPCWLDYPVYARHVGATPVLVPPDRDVMIDPDAIAAAMSERTRAIVLSHPCNPTGHSYTEATVVQLAEAIRARQQTLGTSVTLIADETHRDFTTPGTYRSLTRHVPRTVIVYSFGKYHFLQGQRTGYAAVSPSHPERDDLGAELARWTRITGMATPTALMQAALPRLLAITYDQSWIDRRRAHLAGRLRDAGYRVVDADATLFVYVKTPSGWSDWAFTRRLASRGVLVLPAPVFHHEGWFRVVLTATETMLERALDVFSQEVMACPT